MATKRLRGRAAVAQRRRRLADHPVCVQCDREGRTKATEELDHIVPLSQGGTDDDSNIQGLCKFHHAIKSAGEDGGHQAASNHPDWLKASAVPVKIICGPPGAGKTSYVIEHAEDGDVVIDLDAIALELDPAFAGEWSRSLLNAAIRKRNALLGSLQFASTGRAWFIVGAPTTAERAWWKAMLGEMASIAYLDTDEAICLERGADPRKLQTYFRAAREGWTPPRARRKKVGIGADGYPLD